MYLCLNECGTSDIPGEFGFSITTVMPCVFGRGIMSVLAVQPGSTIQPPTLATSMSPDIPTFSW